MIGHFSLDLIGFFSASLTPRQFLVSSGRHLNQQTRCSVGFSKRMVQVPQNLINQSQS